MTISPRVDGELLSLGFTEGQTVKPGDLLAQIDPRPYRAALDQAIAVKAKDAALLANARLDLQRYETLAPEELTSKQTLETQRALVAQDQAQVESDQAAIDNARTNLAYTTIRSPIQGRTGIRLTDPGNILHAANSTGIVVVTQVQPISVIFTLPADALYSVNRALASGAVAVTALSRDGKTLLGTGTVKLIDNQIDQTTGTIRLKGVFPNQDNKLWPGDFVNARVMVETRHDALTIPSAAIQRGPNGVFAYVVQARQHGRDAAAGGRRGRRQPSPSWKRGSRTASASPQATSTGCRRVPACRSPPGAAAAAAKPRRRRGRRESGAK